MAMWRVKNWTVFQHYKDRNPPWIKLHFEMLSSADWVVASDSERVLAIACMLIASRNGGLIDGSATGLAYLQRVAYLQKVPNLKPLIERGFLEPASTMLADASKNLANARTETEKETEKETEEEEDARARATPDADDDTAADPRLSPSRSEQIEKTKAERASVAAIIDLLNIRTGRNFRADETNSRLIVARFREGYTEAELRGIVALKVRAWLADDKMAQYLRPATLFAKTNCAQYVAELGPRRPMTLDEYEQQRGGQHG